MSAIELKITRIGNSRGVRLPAATLERYQISESVVMEERSDGILLRPSAFVESKLSWDETARAMAADAEDWSEFDVTLGDGMEMLPWAEASPRRVAERVSASTRRTRNSKR